MLLKRWVGLASLTVLGVALAGCSNAAAGKTQPKTIQVVAREFSFEPSTITLKPGEPVILEVRNDGGVLHDLTIMNMPVKDVKDQGGTAQHDMSAADMKAMAAHVAVEAGKTGKVEFTPTQSGTYELYCTVAGHKDSGMTGTVVVQ